MSLSTGPRKGPPTAAATGLPCRTRWRLESPARPTWPCTRSPCPRRRPGPAHRQHPRRRSGDHHAVHRPGDGAHGARPAWPRPGPGPAGGMPWRPAPPPPQCSASSKRSRAPSTRTAASWWAGPAAARSAPSTTPGRRGPREHPAKRSGPRLSRCPRGPAASGRIV